jgi:hypothetical protein
VNYRDRQIMRTHDYHWFDKARLVQLPHRSPIRRDALLYNIFITRAEGLATGWRPRARLRPKPAGCSNSSSRAGPASEDG